MSRDKNQYWVIQREGARRSLRRTRKSSIWAYVESRAALTGSYYTSTQIMPLWRCLYKEGFRCVKVWVYKEQRIRRPVADPVAGIIHHSPREGDYR